MTCPKFWYEQEYSQVDLAKTNLSEKKKKKNRSVANTHCSLYGWITCERNLQVVEWEIHESQDTIIIFSQGEMDIDEDQLECGVLPIRIPLAFHDRFIEEDGEEIISVKCKSKVKC